MGNSLVALPWWRARWPGLSACNPIKLPAIKGGGLTQAPDQDVRNSGAIHRPPRRQRAAMRWTSAMWDSNELAGQTMGYNEGWLTTLRPGGGCLSAMTWASALWRSVCRMAR
jgi:hypothetical protein